MDDSTWQELRLFQIGTVLTGRTPDTQNEKYWGGEIPFATPADFIGSLRLKDTARHVSVEGARSVGSLPKDSVLVTCIGTIGKVKITDRESLVNQQINALICNKEFDPEFVANAICIRSNDLIALSGATTLPIVNARSFASLKIACPHLVFQRRIAEILSTVDLAIEQTEALIAKQQRVKTGLMHDLLTRGIDEHGSLRSEQTHDFKDSPLGRIPAEWEVKPLAAEVDLQVGYAFKSAWFSEEGVRLLRGENVGTGTPDWKDTQYLPHEIAEEFRLYRLTAGDLIIGMDRTFTKQGVKISLLDEHDAPCLLVQRVGRFVPVNIPQIFMQLLVQSPRYQRELLQQQKGMDIPHLSKSEILAPAVPIPSRADEMDSIAKHVEVTRFAERNSLRCLKKLRSLKTALMQALLTGKKRVTALLEAQTVE